MRAGRQHGPEGGVAGIILVLVDPYTKLPFEDAQPAGPFREGAKPVHLDIRERRDEEHGILRIGNKDVVLRIFHVHAHEEIAPKSIEARFHAGALGGGIGHGLTMLRGRWGGAEVVIVHRVGDV